MDWIASLDWFIDSIFRLVLFRCVTGRRLAAIAVYRVSRHRSSARTLQLGCPIRIDGVVQVTLLFCDGIVMRTWLYCHPDACFWYLPARVDCGLY